MVRSAALAQTPAHLAEKILSVRGTVEGERKVVTVLFADLRGSLELLADHDPEDARAAFGRMDMTRWRERSERALAEL